MTFPKLQAPPINEVVCGFLFETLSNFTPVHHGRYWEQSRERFARHEIHPAVEDTLSFLTIGVPPLRKPD